MNWKNNTPTFRQRKTGKSKQHFVLLLVVWLVGLAVDVVDIVMVFAVMVVVVLVAITGGAVVVFGAVALTDLKQVATFPTASTTTSSKSCEQQEAL